MINKIKILYLIDVLYDNAGTENNLFWLVSNINKNRFYPIVCPLAPTDSPMINKFQDSGITVEPIPISKIYNRSGLRQIKSFFKIIKKYQIDILQTIHFSSDIYGTLLGRLFGIPIVISSRRDMGLFENKFRHRMLRKFVNNFVTLTVANANIVREHLIKNEKIPSNKTTLIYNGVNPDKFEKSNEIIPDFDGPLISDNSITIGCVANIRPVKGLEYLIEAVGYLSLEGYNFNLLIVGGKAGLKGNTVIQEYFYKLNDIIKKFGIQKQIHFLGRRSDIPKLLQLMDICVIPSLSEGFSNAILEYMAAGKPVIATQVGGNPEAVVNGSTGFLVPAADSYSLFNAIKSLIIDKPLRKKMGKAGKDRVVEKFSLAKMVCSSETLYESLINNKF